ncbi:hypothetical protein C0431_12685 [bacterium]|nr:hypothetical protein [bacterium]
MIKFKLPTEILTQLAHDLGPVVPTLTAQEILKGIYVHFDKDVVTAVAFNGTVAIRIQRELDEPLNVTPFDVVLSHPKLVSLLKKLNDTYTTLKYDTEREVIDVLSAGSKYRVSALNASDYPSFRQMIVLTSTVAEIHAEEITRAYHSTAGFTMKEESRPVLQGVNHMFSFDTLKLIATDSRILRETSLPLDADASQISTLDAGLSMSLPIVFTNQVHRLLSKREDCSIKFRVGSNAAAYEWDVDAVRTSYTIYTRVIDGAYPDTARLTAIGDGYKRVQVSKQTILELLSRIQATSDASDHVVLAFKGTKGKLLTKGQFPSVESFSLESGYSSDEQFLASFNTNFLQTAVKSFSEDAIGIHVMNKDRPIFFESIEDRTEGLGLVLPIRLNETINIEWGDEPDVALEEEPLVFEPSSGERIAEPEASNQGVTPSIGEAHAALDAQFSNLLPDEGVDQDIDDAISVIDSLDPGTDEEFIFRMEKILDLEDVWMPDFGTDYHTDARIAANNARETINAFRGVTQ